jgi:hypothetical protein
LKPHIRVTVKQAGDDQSYRELLLEALKGSGMKFSAVVEKIVQSLSPNRNMARVRARPLCVWLSATPRW